MFRDISPNYTETKATATAINAAPAPAVNFIAEDGLELAEAAAPAAPVAGEAVACALTPPLTKPLSPSLGSDEPMARAAALKASNVLPVAAALTDPTMPIPQCSCCLQWNQIGFESSVIVMVNTLPVCRPESNPPGAPLAAARKVQGAEKLDWVTEWATAELGKKKLTFVPFEAVKLLGLKTNLPWNATSTLTLPGVFAGAEGAAAAAAEVAEVPEVEVELGVSPPP